MKLNIRFQSAEARKAGVDLEKLLRELERGSRKGGMLTSAITIKDDRTTTLYRVQSEIGDLIVKRYNTKNLGICCGETFKSAVPESVLRWRIKFSSAGIRVAQPVAMIESRFGPFAGRSWYICRFVDSIVLTDYLGIEDRAAPPRSIQGKLRAIFEVFLNHDFSHGDMKATNLLVHDDDLVVIDLDSAKQHRFKLFHLRALRRDKARFLKNWNDRPLLYRHFERELENFGL